MLRNHYSCEAETAMKFLIINTDYPEFLTWLYTRNTGLENKSYDEQMRVRMDSLFGIADFYSSNLKKLGHEVWDIHAMLNSAKIPVTLLIFS